MRPTHQITCAHDDCPEWSIRAALQPTSPDQLAADHRTTLATEGWTDREGRDYCPDHTPAGATR
jgi:hypothetical protein